jgi:hypothetical protein
MRAAAAAFQAAMQQTMSDFQQAIRKLELAEQAEELEQQSVRQQLEQAEQRCKEAGHAAEAHAAKTWRCSRPSTRPASPRRSTPAPSPRRGPTRPISAQCVQARPSRRRGAQARRRARRAWRTRRAVRHSTRAQAAKQPAHLCCNAMHPQAGNHHASIQLAAPCAQAVVTTRRRSWARRRRQLRRWRRVLRLRRWRTSAAAPGAAAGEEDGEEVGRRVRVRRAFNRRMLCACRDGNLSEELTTRLVGIWRQLRPEDRYKLFMIDPSLRIGSASRQVQFSRGTYTARRSFLRAPCSSTDARAGPTRLGHHPRPQQLFYAAVFEHFPRRHYFVSFERKPRQVLSTCDRCTGV